MGRMPVLSRPKSFNPRGCPRESTWGITRRFHRLSPGRGLVAYALRTRAPISGPRRGLPVRLACIRPAASVHPEPGSNSSLYYCCTFSFSCFRAPLWFFAVPYSRNGPSLPAHRLGLMLASSFQRTFQTSFFTFLLSLFGTAKVQPFFILASIFWSFFSKKI